MSQTSSVAPTPSTAVKDAIDANSGRYEFFKQALTLGSAGLAGLAAIFTDPTRIPSERVLKITAAASGLSLLAVVAFAAMGVSAYANLLMAVGREAGLVPPSRPKHTASSFFARGVVRHARGVVLAMAVAWLSLAFFAGWRTFASPDTSVETALAEARALVARETGQSSASLLLTSLRQDHGAYVATYVASSVPSEVTVQVSRRGGAITNLVQRKLSGANGATPP